jgi:hypothetical protein
MSRWKRSWQKALASGPRDIWWNSHRLRIIGHVMVIIIIDLIMDVFSRSRMEIVSDVSQYFHIMESLSFLIYPMMS